MLEPIVESTRARVELLHTRAGEITARARDAAPPRDFAAALSAPGLQIIAEIKRRSPSAGVIAAHLDPAAQAEAYRDGGAAAISVLTEPGFFGGSLDDLAAVRAAVRLPILRKDFTIDALQVWEALAGGADAILLILAILSDHEVRELLAVAADAGLSAVVEAHSIDEVERAIACGAEIVGVNNRDLTTFVTDLATAEVAGPRLAAASVRVAESGVSNPEGAARMSAAGYDAILVGEAAVRSDDPARFIASLRAAGR